MASNGTNTNTEFELRGFNHVVIVCRDMAETVAWYEDKLGMKLVKTLELPGDHGQHFFMDMGNGTDGIAFFWFPDAPEGRRGEVLQNSRGVTAIGSTNHIAFDVPPVETFYQEIRATTNPLGLRGLGECGNPGLGAAIANAVCDAFRGMGATLTALPVTPASVRRAIERAGT